MISCICLTTWPKRAEYLSDALLCYQMQDHADRRLIIVNDGSPIDSMRSDVHVINVSKQSIGAKRQCGILHAADSWASTWDDDDIYLPDHLSVVARETTEKKVQYLYATRYLIADRNLTIGAAMKHRIHQSNLFYAPYALAVGGYPDLNYCEDGVLFRKLYSAGIPIGAYDRITHVRRQHGHNISSEFEPDFLDNEHRVSQAVEDQKRWPDPEIQAWQARLYALLQTPRQMLIHSGV